MLDNLLLEVGKGLGVGFGSGYAGVVGIKTGYYFLTRGEKSLDRFLTKITEQMVEPSNFKATVYVGGAISLAYILLK